MTEKILSGRYVLQEIVGAGGMAVVYRAWDRVALREVAVKVLREEFSLDEDFIRRFNHEAQAASKMSHENIVSVYDVGQDGDVRYIVMEFVDGRTLKDVIRQAGRIEERRAVQMVLRILAAVDCAHKNHIIHRDIKPQNILVDTQGNIKVADFGIARVTNGATQTYTSDNNVLGSVHYFSPEQASGQVADEKSDLYSVGVVLFEMVTGEVPFDGDTPVSVALKHVQEPPRSARAIEPEISKALDEVIGKALDKESSCRYQTAAEMANDLKRAIRSPKGGFVSVTPSPDEIQQKLEKRRRRHQMLLRVRNGSIAAIVVAILASGWLIFSDIYGKVRVQLPNYAMLKVEDAMADLDKLDLEYTVEEKHHDEIGLGYVISQYPDPNTVVTAGDRIQLVVSAGKDKLVMPKLLELTRAEAVRVIEDNDLTLNDVVLEVSDAETGTVVAQSPAVNEWVKAGDRVTLHVSGESAYVPDVTDQTLDEATAQLLSMGYKVSVEETYDDTPENTVLAQSVEPDTRLLLGTTITLTVSEPMPDTYRAQVTLEVSIPEGGAHVICTLEESAGEREIYNAVLEKGSQTIKLDMDSFEKGVHIVRVYRGEKLLVEKDVEFTK